MGWERQEGWQSKEGLTFHVGVNRKVDESIIIGDNIKITVVYPGDQQRSIEAPGRFLFIGKVLQIQDENRRSHVGPAG